MLFYVSLTYLNYMFSYVLSLGINFNLITMKYFKNLSIYFFATIGFIVIACGGAALVEEEGAAVVQSNNGKYQLSVSTAASQYGSTSMTITYLTVLNTATGSMKTYSRSGNNTWQENSGMSMTFNH